MAAPAAAYIFTALAVAELIGDKLPFVPSRLTPGPLGARVVSGGLCGAVLCAAAQQSLAMGVIIGGIAGLAGSFAGFAGRKYFTAASQLPGFLVAIGEDLCAIASGGAGSFPHLTAGDVESHPGVQAVKRMSSAGHPCYSGHDGSTDFMSALGSPSQPWCTPVPLAMRQMKRPTAEVSPVAATDGATSRQQPRTLALRVALPEGFHVQSNAPRDPTLIPTVLTIERRPASASTEIVYPPPDGPRAGRDRSSRSPCSSGSSRLASSSASTRRLPPGEIARAGSPPLPGVRRAAVLRAGHRRTRSGRSASLPTDATIAEQHRDGLRGHRVRPRNEAAAGRGPPASLRPARRWRWPDNRAASRRWTGSPSSAAPAATSARPSSCSSIHDAEARRQARGLFEGRGPLAILLLVLVGGLALNLTPCVLPMIPINLAIIGAGAQAGSRGRGFLLGSAYGGAMAVVYGVLGLVVILTAGTFGTINASPWFNLGIAVLFVVLGARDVRRAPDRLLAVLDDASSRRPASRGSVALAFTMGAVAALLAGACVAPVVIQVVLFSSNLYATGTTRRARAAVRARHRHGDSVADRRRRPRGAAEAGRVDGARQAGVRRRHPRHRALLRLRGVHALREPLGRPAAVDVERATRS